MSLLKSYQSTKKSALTMEQWYLSQPLMVQYLLWPFIRLGYLFFNVLSGGVALIAAVAKGLGYAYGTLILIAFFKTHSLAIVGSLLSWPYILLGAIITFSIFFLSLAMEGRKTQKNIYEVYDHFPQRLVALKAYIIQYYLRVSWGTFFKNFSIEFFNLGYLLAPGAGLAKGASMAAGALGMCFALLSLLAVTVTSNLLFVVTIYGLMAGMCVGCVSFVGKEGPQFNKHINRLKDYLRGCSNATKAKTLTGSCSFDKSALFVAWLLPIVAATAKAFGYAFGTLTLLAFITTGPAIYAHTSLIFSAAVLTVPHIMLVIGVAFSIFCVSLGMEGLYTTNKLYYRITGEYLRAKKQITKQAPKKAFVNQPIKKSNWQWPGLKEARLQDYALLVSYSFVSLASGLSVLGPISKGTSMMSGTIGMLLAISVVMHLHLSLPAVIFPALVLGIAATGVSLGKEWSDDLLKLFARFKQRITEQILGLPVKPKMIDEKRSVLMHSQQAGTLFTVAQPYCLPEELNEKIVTESYTRLMHDKQAGMLLAQATSHLEFQTKECFKESLQLSPL